VTNGAAVHRRQPIRVSKKEQRGGIGEVKHAGPSAAVPSVLDGVAVVKGPVEERRALIDAGVW